MQLKPKLAAQPISDATMLCCCASKDLLASSLTSGSSRRQAAMRRVCCRSTGRLRRRTRSEQTPLVCPTPSTSSYGQNRADTALVPPPVSRWFKYGADALLLSASFHTCTPAGSQ